MYLLNKFPITVILHPHLRGSNGSVFVVFRSFLTGFVEKTLRSLISLQMSLVLLRLSSFSFVLLRSLRNTERMSRRGVGRVVSCQTSLSSGTK